jgi:hypothetical protein
MINLNSSGDHESRLTQKSKKFLACKEALCYSGQNNRLSGEFTPKINVKMG